MCSESLQIQELSSIRLCSLCMAHWSRKVCPVGGANWGGANPIFQISLCWCLYIRRLGHSPHTTWFNAPSLHYSTSRTQPLTAFKDQCRPTGVLPVLPRFGRDLDPKVIPRESCCPLSACHIQKPSHCLRAPRFLRILAIFDQEVVNDEVPRSAEDSCSYYIY